MRHRSDEMFVNCQVPYRSYFTDFSFSWRKKIYCWMLKYVNQKIKPTPTGDSKIHSTVILPCLTWLASNRLDWNHCVPSPDQAQCWSCLRRRSVARGRWPPNDEARPRSPTEVCPPASTPGGRRPMIGEGLQPWQISAPVGEANPRKQEDQCEKALKLTNIFIYWNC